MRTPKELAAFLNGPLKDENGGSEEMRVSCLSSFRNGGDTIPRSSSSLGSDSSFLLSSNPPLFDYQREIVNGLFDWLDSGNKSSLVSLPTGGGKTRTALWFFRECIEKELVKSLVWIAPSKELVFQAATTFSDLWHEFPSSAQVRVSIGRVQKQSGRLPTASFLTAQRATRHLSELGIAKPELLIFDEAHQAVARTFREILKTQASTGGLAFGLSATPGRSLAEEGEDLLHLFGNNLIVSRKLGKNPVTFLREQGVLSEINMSFLPLPTAWEQTRVKSLESKSMNLEGLASNNARFWATVSKLDGLPTKSKTLVFCASIAHCHALRSALTNKRLVSAVVSHKTPDHERDENLRAFEAGEINIIFNKSILATGYDCPEITDVVLASPIRSPILWEQIIGRVSRGPRVGGTEVGYVWELDDHRRMHREIMSYARYLGDLWNSR